MMLAWAGNTLAGQYAASQAPLLVNGVLQPSALSMSTMTHPDFRGQGLLQLLGEALYDQLSQDDFTCAWGFPNPMINGTRQKKLAWQPICDVPSLSLELERARPENDSFEQVKIADWDAFFSDADPEVPLGKIQSLRTAEILKWRTNRNPINTYSCFTTILGNGECGYAVCKAFGENDLDLVELRTTGAETAGLLVDRAIALAREKGIKQLNTWSLPCDENRLVLERRGFAATSPVTYFGGRSFSTSDTAFDDPRNWRLSMLDSDLY